jgi:hypothetical protein
VRYILGLIQDYCLKEKLPPLTILVVNQGGKPSTGFIAYDVDKFEEGKSLVHSYNWSSIPNPFAFASGGTATNNRKSFIQSQGATCANWTWSWSFVNVEKQTVIFGAWDKNTEGSRSLILSEAWATNRAGRKSPAYPQSREHIRLVEEQGYKLLTFPIIFSDELQEVALQKSKGSNLYLQNLVRVGGAVHLTTQFQLQLQKKSRILKDLWKVLRRQSPSMPMSATARPDRPVSNTMGLCVPSATSTLKLRMEQLARVSFMCITSFPSRRFVGNTSLTQFVTSSPYAPTATQSFI